MRNYIVEFLKLNPTATAQWGTTYWKDEILAEMPALEAGIIIDVHGANRKDIVMPAGCNLSIHSFFYGVDGNLVLPSEEKTVCYIKGLNAASVVGRVRLDKKSKYVE